MKRVELIRTIEGFGCVLARHGGKHDWYRNPATNISSPSPVTEHLARHIVKILSNR